MKLDFSKTTTSISLESQLEKLALEANFLSNVITTFKETLPNFVSKLANLNLLSSKDGEELSSLVTGLTGEYKQLQPKLKYANFINFEKTLVSVPEGFKGNLLDYLKLLNKDQALVYKQANELLKNFHSTLADFVTNKDSKITNKTELTVIKDAENAREDFNKELNKFFTGGSGSKTYLKTVMRRFNDFDALVDEVKNIDKVHISQNLTSIHNQVQACVDLLNVIIEHTSKNNITEVSGVSALNISKGAYEIGKYIEFVSVYRYKVMQAIHAVDKLIIQFNEVIK